MVEFEREFEKAAEAGDWARAAEMAKVCDFAYVKADRAALAMSQAPEELARAVAARLTGWGLAEALMRGAMGRPNLARCFLGLLEGQRSEENLRFDAQRLLACALREGAGEYVAWSAARLGQKDLARIAGEEARLSNPEALAALAGWLPDPAARRKALSGAAACAAEGCVRAAEALGQGLGKRDLARAAKAAREHSNSEFESCVLRMAEILEEKSRLEKACAPGRKRKGSGGL